MADIIRVAAQSRATAVAGAIAGVVRDQGRAEVQAIGAGAVNQAIKAVAIARGFLALDGLDVICIPMFADVEIGGQERTAIRFAVEPRKKVLFLGRMNQVPLISAWGVGVGVVVAGLGLAVAMGVVPGQVIPAWSPQR
jgi:stage V sporulation protein S